MPERTKRRNVVLSATKEVELEPGVLLPAGFYDGVSNDVGVETSDGVSWTPQTYLVELTGAQLATIGATATNDLVSTEFDVTEHVRSGRIEVL